MNQKKRTFYHALQSFYCSTTLVFFKTIFNVYNTS